MYEDRSGEGEGGHRRPASGRRSASGRRRFLKTVGSTAGLLALAGCGNDGSGGDGTATPAPGSTDGGTDTPAGTVPEPRTYAADELYNIDEWRGTGPLIEDRPDEYTGISMLDLPDLRGELTVYLGGGEGGLYENLMWRIQQTYRDFTVDTRKASSSQLANTIIEEATAGSSPADVFWAIDAGSIGIVAENDATVELPDRVVRSIPDTFHPTDQWVGTMGRARSVPYNTDEFSADDIPNDIMAFPDDDRFDAMGWAPTYGAFQSFVTAMRLLEGEDTTRQWLDGMQQQGIGTYDNELVVANQVASGELGAGFGNHYYSRLVREERPDAPLELAFTQGDAGALINCSGTEIIKGTDNEELAADFIHHLLSIEAQEFLGTRGYEYPLLPSVPPVGDLPRIDELNPPDLNLAELSDLEPTLRLLRETGVL
ncbi:extracellular solute-binding protein [Halosimplex pelagicum]|uniref:Extracellular solute-binding protein n=1 Tax=Halosimplex pelagicum TaxID=869886 RepID=A0A7D5P557_9EURY|nr:extracellular solute-binding protein [Halosimplex pelagicum]QLH81126.1 extracellular solute-binding protein [Halosimplex pelagicum]